MKRIHFLTGVVFLLGAIALIAASAFADITNSLPLDQENLPENLVEKPLVLPIQLLPGAQADPIDTIASTETTSATETRSDKEVAVLPQTAPNQAVNDTVSGVTSPAGNKKFPAAMAETDKQGKDKAPLNEDSYTSNETALKAVGKSVSLFKDRIKERFSLYLERSAQYIEIMKEILREKKLPEELVFLPIVESGFNPNAYSRARAVGPWQFIASTGKRYGLVIDWWRDERKDPVKSTMAAAEYLKDLYKMFGSWNLALAAYNAGEGKISKALRRSDSDNYWSLLNTKQIRNETKEYVPRYIAAAMIANTPEEYGFNNLDYREPLEYDEVTIISPLDVDIIAKCAECTEGEIRELNPELRRWSTPPNVLRYTIRIPAGSKDIFVQNLAAVPKKEQFTVEQYTLKKGDTIKKIARKTGIPSATIVAMNSLNGSEHLGTGHMIALPPKGKFSPDTDDRASTHNALIHKTSRHNALMRNALTHNALMHKVAYKKKITSRHSGKKINKRSPGKIVKAKGKKRVRANRA
ncbi:MAG: transglycosylase SLT domain-containing protein [Dissulfurispiraceae bacterium]